VKFNPSWQQIVFFGLLLAAPVIAHLVAPGAAPTVTGMVTTALGFLFGNRFRGEDETKEGGQ
jgi:hypothetical protein